MDLTEDAERTQNVLTTLFEDSYTNAGGKRYVPKHSRVTEQQVCGGKRSTMTFGQALVYVVCKFLAVTNNPNRGLLVYHSVGSGKTCAAVAAMCAFEKTNRTFVYMSSVAGLRSNPPDKFFSCAQDLFPWMDKESFHKRLHHISFAKMAHALNHKSQQPESNNEGSVYRSRRKALAKCLLVVDEVHKLFHPLPHQREEHEFLIRFLTDESMSRDYDMKVVCMTATIGDSPDELVKLMNIVRDRRRPEIVVPTFDGMGIASFKRQIAGLVSYVDLSGSNVFPTMVDEIVDTLMSEEQASKYRIKMATMDDAEKDLDRLQRNKNEEAWMRSARKYANSQYTLDQETAEFSSKIPALLERVLSRPREKHYVYSAFYERRGYGGHGVYALARMLTEFHGYEKMTLEEAIAHVADGTKPRPAKRYMVLTSAELSGDGSERAEALNLDVLVKLFNSYDNRYGELVHVILASQNYNESIDLKAVRHLHLLEPLVSYNKEIQARGRAVRYCSHDQLAKEFGKHTVYVHSYFANTPPLSATFVQVQNIVKAIDHIDVLTQYAADGEEERALHNEREELIGKLKQAYEATTAMQQTVDHVVYREARERYKQMKMLLDAVIDMAVDNRLTKAIRDAAK